MSGNKSETWLQVAYFCHYAHNKNVYQQHFIKIEDKVAQ